MSCVESARGIFSRIMDSELNSMSELNSRSHAQSRHEDLSVDSWTRNATRGDMYRFCTRTYKSTHGLGTKLEECTQLEKSCTKSVRVLISRLVDSRLNSRSDLNSRSHAQSRHEDLSVDSWTQNSTRGVMRRVGTRTYQSTRGLETQLEE